MFVVLEINGWRSGLKKVQLTKILRETMGLSLREAKSITDRTLLGASSAFRFDNLYEANDVHRKLEDAGAIAQILQFEEPTPVDDYLQVLAKQIIGLFVEPVDDRRLLTTQRIVNSIAKDTVGFSKPQNEQLLRVIREWQDRRSIYQYPIPRDKENQDWFEAVIGTITGILSVLASTVLAVASFFRVVIHLAQSLFVAWAHLLLRNCVRSPRI